jgi:flagellar assembly protein FliH
MSTSAPQVEIADVAAGRSAWVQPKSYTHVSPLFVPDALDDIRRQQARDMVLPSPSAERTAAVEREAYARGFSVGERAGLDAARAGAESGRARLDATIADIAQLRVGMIERAQHDLLRLAVAIAERVIRREIRLDRERLLAMAEATLPKLGAAAVATVLLNPEDIAAITATGRELPANGPLRVQPDVQILPGGCLVKSAFGTIDLGLEAQLREILDGLLTIDSDAGR